jgi:hypothetical protein
MSLGSEVGTGSVSPLPWGEVELRSNSGEGVRPIDRPYPLTPALSQSKSDLSAFDNLSYPTRVNPSWAERGRTSVAVTSKYPLKCKDFAR